MVVFAYYIFYNIPLEIAPGSKMGLSGNLHCNEDVWIQSKYGLELKSKMTVAGKIHHGRRSGSGQDRETGYVKIADASGNLVNLKDSGV